MHGAFIVGLKELIVSRFEESNWLEIIQQAGFEPGFHPLSNQEIDDDKAWKLIKESMVNLHLNDRQFGQIFGNYWIKTFAREKYFAFFDAFKSSKEFIQNLTGLHKKITANLKDKNPPEFEIVWETPQSALITYKSKRGMIHFAVGLLKALGDYYNEEISVYRIETDKIKVFFKT